MMNTRPIHTSTYTAISQHILEKLHYNLDYNWGSNQMSRNCRVSTVERQPDGEVTWTIKGDGYSNSYYRSAFSKCANDKEVREWICAYLKGFCMRWWKRNGYNDNKNWARDNDAPFLPFSTPEVTITVKDIYCLYEQLLNRKSFDKRWGHDMVERIIGAQRDPIMTEMEVARREEVANIETEYADKIKKLDNDRYREIERMREEIAAKYRKLQEDLAAEKANKIRELNESLSFMSAD